MSYEPERRIKKFTAVKVDGVVRLYGVCTDDSIWEYMGWTEHGDAWDELQPIPGTPRHRELSVRDGLPEDEP